MIIRIMIDMETTATSARAGILTFGACTFGADFERVTFYQRASLKSNEVLKREISRSTLLWWDKPENEEMRREAFTGSLAVDDVLDHFRNWCATFDNTEDIELWSRGAGFDCEILQDAFLQIFGSYPFDFRKHMCQRTIERLMPDWLKVGIPAHKSKHHALEDAIYQANVMEVALRNLQWAPPTRYYARGNIIDEG